MRALLIDHVGIGPSSPAEEVTLGDVEQAMQACGLQGRLLWLVES